MRLAHGAYSQAGLSAVQHWPHIGVREHNKEQIMAYIPSKPILADDPLAYFSALKVQKSRSAPSLPMTPAVRAIDLMYGYYSVE